MVTFVVVVVVGVVVVVVVVVIEVVVVVGEEVTTLVRIELVTVPIRFQHPLLVSTTPPSFLRVVGGDGWWWKHFLLFSILVITIIPITTIQRLIGYHLSPIVAVILSASKAWWSSWWQRGQCGRNMIGGQARCFSDVFS